MTYLVSGCHLLRCYLAQQRLQLAETWQPYTLLQLRHCTALLTEGMRSGNRSACFVLFLLMHVQSRCGHTLIPRSIAVTVCNPGFMCVVWQPRAQAWRAVTACSSLPLGTMALSGSIALLCPTCNNHSTGALSKVRPTTNELQHAAVASWHSLLHYEPILLCRCLHYSMINSSILAALNMRKSCIVQHMREGVTLQCTSVLVVQGLWSCLCSDGLEVPWRCIPRYGVPAQLV